MTLSDMQRSISDTMRDYSGLLLAQGIIVTVLGILAVIWPQISTVATDIFVGWLFLLSGILGLVTLFLAPNAPAFFWSLLTAGLSLFAGVLLLWHPVEGSISLTLVLIALFIAEGIFQIAAAIRYRDTLPDSWGWLLMSGIVDLVLAGVIISGWPQSANWALGLVVGVNLITSGLAITMMAVTARKVGSALRS